MPRGERILLGLFLVLALGAAWLALDFNAPEARSFPLWVALFTAGLILAYWAISASEALSTRFRAYIVDELFVKADSQADASDDVDEGGERRSRERLLITMLGLFGILAWAVGLTIAVPLLLIVAMRWFGRETWPLTLAVTAGTCLFLYVVFVAVLRLQLHFGLLGRL